MEIPLINSSRRHSLHAVVFAITVLVSFPDKILLAQVKTGEVNYENLGIRFTIPEGWKGRETESGFLIGHDTQPGIISITTHNYKNMDQIRQLARQGIRDENGTNLMLNGDLTDYNNGVGGEFKGTLQWNPVKFYIIALTNPNGYGIMIMSGTNTEQYSSIYKQLAEKIAGSIVFSKPETGPVVGQWKQKLVNKRLTYIDSYYSSGTGYDGYSTGGGYSSTIKIDICGKGYFNYTGNSSMSVDTGGSFGSSAGNNQGSGTWEIIGNASGGATLILHFNNGNTSEYELTVDNGKTLLNGKRYFVTDGSYQADNAPQCY